jgi:signal transduction histidine kinase
VGLERRAERVDGSVESGGEAHPELEPQNAVRDLAHDMRSPLTSILFLVDTILRGRSGPITADQERQLRLVYSAAWGLSTLASDVIDATRGHRLLEGKPAPFSISETIHGVRDIVRPIAEERGLSIELQMPSIDGRLGYSTAVSRVLLNLASNALQHTDRGSIFIGCSEQQRDRVAFWVEDTGCGMDISAPGVHKAPRQRSSSSQQFSTTGLGLVICRNLLDAMGSCLEHTRAAAGGTRFTFELDLPVA